MSLRMQEGSHNDDRACAILVAWGLAKAAQIVLISAFKETSGCLSDCSVLLPKPAGGSSVAALKR